MPENDKLTEVEFPGGGIDRTGEFQEQPPGTTPEAVNVRAVNPDTLRDRGGSRAGLIRYIPGPLFVGADMIQHLNVIVDPQAAALQQVFIVPGDDWVEDPLNPGFFVPPGGWGFQPNPNAPPPAPGGGIAFVQSSNDRREWIDPPGGERTYDFATWFDSEPVIGNTLVVALMTVEDTPGSALNVTATVTNDSGATYERLGSGGANGGYERVTVPSGEQMTVSLWRKKVAATADQTLKINMSDPDVFVHWIMVEYANVANSTPAGFAFNNSAGPTTALSTSGFTLGSANQMALAAFATYRSATGVLALSPMLGFTARENINVRAALHLHDDVDHGAEVGLNITATSDSNCAYCAVGAGYFAG